MSQLSIIKKEVSVAKEMGEAIDLLIGVVQDVKAGKSAMEIGMGRLDDLIAAINGADKIDDEVRENQEAALNTVGLGLARLGNVLLKPKAKPDSPDVV